MSFVSSDKLVGLSPTSYLDINSSPFPFVSHSGPVAQVARSILKKSTPISPSDQIDKKVSWSPIEKDIRVLEPINLDDFDIHYRQRLEALRSDVSLAAFVPTDPDLDPDESSAPALSRFSDAIRENPLLSVFIPKVTTQDPSKILSSKDLAKISDKIRHHSKTEVLLKYVFMFFITKSKKFPNLIGEAVDKLLTGTKIRSCVHSAVFALSMEVGESDYREIEARIEKVTSDKALQPALFAKIVHICQKKGLFNEFVEILLSLMPLEEVAGIRLTIDQIAIAKKLNELLPAAAQFKDIENLYKQIPPDINRLLINWLHTCKVDLEKVEELNLSGVEIQRFSNIMISYIPNIKRITLARTHLMSVVLKDLYKFPHLKELNLSSNNLNADDLNFIFDDIKNIKTLTSLDVSNNPIRWDEISEITTFCEEHNIKLDISEYSKILSAKRSGAKALNLSGLRIETFPEELLNSFLEVDTVIFQRSLASPSQTLEIMTTLLKMPEVKVFDFSNNSLSPASINALLDAAQEYAPNARIIRDLSKAELNLISVLKRLDLEIPERFKSYEDLRQKVHSFIEVQKEFLEAIVRLDFSNIAIETLPSELIVYFKNVKHLLLQSSYLKKSKYGSGFSCLLDLPKLELIDLSDNRLSTSMFLNLANLVEKPQKALKRIKLSGCTYKYNDLEKLSILCRQNNVTLILEPDKRKREILDPEYEGPGIFAKHAKI